MTQPIRHPLLVDAGVEHGFGIRGWAGPPELQRPVQVHGCAVVHCSETRDVREISADAVACRTPGLAVAVVTADCLPILACSEDGSAVAAIHAGWRGQAARVNDV